MEQTKIVQFKGNSFTVSLPNNRQYVQIQNLKTSLASNYDSLEYNGPEGMFAQSIVDAESHLHFMCPDLIRSLNKSFSELSLIESRELVELYAKEIRPWYNEFLNFVFKINKEDDKQEV